MTIVRLLPPALLAISLFGTTAMAQDARTSGALSIEMNDLAPSEKGCKLTFVAGNGLPQSLSKVSF